MLDRDETLKVQLDLDSATSAGTVNVSDATAETRITDSSEVTVSVKAAVFVEDDPDYAGGRIGGHVDRGGGRGRPASRWSCPGTVGVSGRGSV